MPWYHFQRGGWGIAVDAVSLADAHAHIKVHAPGATCQGEYTPPTRPTTCMDTAMTTAKRQEIISAHFRKQE